MKNLSTNKAIAMLWLFMIFFGGCIFSCNPVNRVNKSPERQLKVIKNYAANHGFRNDTVRVVKKGDSVVVERTDTVTNVVTVKDSDTVTIYKHIYNTRTVEKTDTVFEKINNRESEIALSNIIKDNDKVISDCRVREAEIKGERNEWRLRFYILSAIFVLLVFLIFKK